MALKAGRMGGVFHSALLAVEKLRQAVGTAKTGWNQRRDGIQQLPRGLKSLVRARSVALGQDVVAQRKKLRELVQGRLEQHAATVLDQSLSDIDVLDAMTELGELEVKRRAAYDALLIQLGMSSGASIVPGPSGQGCEEMGEPESLSARAQASNPRLRAYRAQVVAAEAEHRQQALALIPW